MTEPKKPDTGAGWVVVIIIWGLISWWWNATPTPTPVAADHATSIDVDAAVEDGTADLRDSLSELQQAIEDQEYELDRLRRELREQRDR